MTVPLAAVAIFWTGPLWLLIAVAMSVGLEGRYYQWRVIQAPWRLRWRWIVAGNVLSSSILLMLLPTLALAIKEAQPRLEWHLYILCLLYYELFWESVFASVALFLGSFFAPGLLRRMR
ncbi:MAG: hypothetical protein N3E46_06865 [Gemmataceae bacterium]|nr:hypothetical protein [Gemmataceae bacterium]